METNKFVATPAFGCAPYVKHMTNAVRMYAGPMLTRDNQALRIEIIAREQHGYDVKVLNVDKDKGPMWAKIDEFHMNSFGKLRSQTVTAPVLGRLKVWPSLTRKDKRHCIRFVQLDVVGTLQSALPF